MRANTDCLALPVAFTVVQLDGGGLVRRDYKMLIDTHVANSTSP